MKIILATSCFAVIFTLVWSQDFVDDNSQVTAVTKPLDNESVDECISTIRQTFVTVFDMSNSRAAKANQTGLTCYGNLYYRYGQHFQQYLPTLEAVSRNDSDANRQQSVCDVAKVVVTMKWDESWRKNHNDTPIQSKPEFLDCASILKGKFILLQTAITTALSAIGTIDQVKGLITAGQFYTNLGILFEEIYPEAKTCCANDVRCLRVFVNEMKRFLYLATLGKAPDVVALIQNITPDV